MQNVEVESIVPRVEDERRLIERCQEGDHLAFEQLYQRYARDVYTMALRMSGSEEVAEEVTQEVFISIYKNIRKFQFQSAFTTWVYRIALRRAADYYRKNQKHTRQAVSLSAGGETEPALDVSDPTQDPLKQAAEDERAQKIEEAILSLREKQRSILLLRYVKHLSYEEIAEILRCRVGTVKSRLNRAHKALEQLLREKRIDSL